MAPFTSPAMSTKVIRVGMICFDLAISASRSSRASGTATSPTLGSMVQNGKFAACAAAVCVSALKSVRLADVRQPDDAHAKAHCRLLAENRAVIGGGRPRRKAQGLLGPSGARG